MNEFEKFIAFTVAASIVIGISVFIAYAGEFAGYLKSIAGELSFISKRLAESVAIMRDETGWIEAAPECDCEDCTWKRQYSPIDSDDYDPDALDDLDDELSDSGNFFDPDERDRPRKPPKK